MFVFGDFSVNNTDWLAYSGGTERPGELCYRFPISTDFTTMVNVPTQITDCDPQSPALLNLFIFSDTNICSTMAFPPLGNSGRVAVSVYIDFLSKSQWDVLIDQIA